MNKKKIAIITSVIVLLILAILGASYAYYSATVKENNKTQTVIKTNELSLTFNGTSEITAEDMIPGDSFTKTFTVENTSNVKTSYNIYMENITNEFNEDLVYILSDETGEVVAETPLPQTNAGKTYLLENIEIEAGVIKSYILKIEFKYLDTPQNDYQDKTFNATIGIDANKVTLENHIKVNATDSQGNNLNATASNITGEEKENLLASLEETGYITNKDEVDALIEVESDDFNDLATTTFDVSSIAETGDTVVILHFDEKMQEWEYIGTETVSDEGKVTGDFSSYSPVAFVVVKEDGTYENLTGFITKAYTYNQDSTAANYCVTGEESTCERTKCYENDQAGSCVSGTIVDYKVNDAKIVRFHVMYDNGSTMILQAQQNQDTSGIEWIRKKDYASANTDSTTCSNIACNDEGPLTAQSYLEKSTASWTNVNDQTYTMGTTTFKTNAYTGCSSYNTCAVNAYTLPEKTVKARMITVQEVTDLGCTGTSKSCSIWMYNYLSSSTNSGGTINDTNTDGYWTMNGYSSDSTYAYAVSKIGKIMVNYVYNTVYGVRAVVEINK